MLLQYSLLGGHQFLPAAALHTRPRAHRNPSFPVQTRNQRPYAPDDTDGLSLDSTSATDMQLIEPYQPRPVLCIDQWDLDGWRLKIYGITYGGSEPGAPLVATARKIAVSVFVSTP